MLLISLSALTAAPDPAHAFSTTTITIDGNFSDWVGVLADPDNLVVDTQIPNDPDWPGQPDRDVYMVAATYDSEYLYFLWRRTAGGTKAITFGAYLDYEGDGLLQDSDRVVLWTVSTGNPYASAANGTAWILKYNQARNSNGTLYHPAGDPMRDTHRTGVPSGDGETPDGWANWQSGYFSPARTMDAYIDPVSGIVCEGRVAWSDLGVAPGHPFAIHFAAGNGESWGVANKPSVTYKSLGGGVLLEENRGQVEDNVEPILHILRRGVVVSPDGAQGGAGGTTVTYTHTVTNLGSTAETFDLTAFSSNGWSVTITDASGDPLTALSLAAGASGTVLVHVSVPTATRDGTVDITTLTATSRSDPGVSDSATDTTRVGRVTVTPDQSATMAPGQTATYDFTVQNNMVGTQTFDLTTSSSLGWTTSLTDEWGNPITSLTLGEGESQIVRVYVQVPPGASVGEQDVTRLVATLQGTPSVRGSATAQTTVQQGLTITPDNQGTGGANSFVQYTHTVTNSWPDTRTVSLSALSSRGWTVRLYDSDGVTQINQVTLGPNGASRDIIVRIFIPAGTAGGTNDVTTVTASTSGASDSAIDITTVRRLLTYEDPGFVNQSDLFVLGDTVYARATGLSAGSRVYFVFKDANGATVYTGPVRTVDTQGMAFEQYTTRDTDAVGRWTVEVRSSGGALLDSYPFTVTYEAEITALSATDAPRAGDEVAVTSSVVNHNSVSIANSTMTYVIWWDSNGDGTFSAGDTYIDGIGMPHVWDGAAAVSTHVTAGITVAPGGTWSESTPWTVRNTDFPSQGAYRVTATWTTASGLVIDTATTQFFSIPTLGWLLFAVLIGGAAYAMSRRLRMAGGERPCT